MYPGETMVAILGYSREQIIAAVREMYTAVAETPQAHFHFPTGQNACRLLGYPSAQLRALPESIVESFAGVGCPFRAGVIRHGDTVLDIGAGTGADTLIAGRMVGPEGHAIALDLTAAMTRKLERIVEHDGIPNVSVVQASAENLPLDTSTVDCITSNGALNLIPAKRRAVAEMFRVLRPGGRLQLADVVIKRPVMVDCSEDPRLWVECVVGATVDEELIALLRDAGFEDVEIVRSNDYFAHSPSRQTREVAAGFSAYSLELTARRSAAAPGRWRQWLRRLDPRRLVATVSRRGFAGIASLLLAVVVCYGGLMAVTVLPLFGLGFALDPMAWAGTIMTLTLLAALAILISSRRRRAPGPPVIAVAGAGLVGYALFVDYHILVELGGFVLLAAAACLDLRARRDSESRVLGLDSPH